VKLWLISQTTNNDYDTYDSAVVCAETEEAARGIHPSGSGWEYSSGSWVSEDKVTVRLIGEATEDIPPGVVLASFNAG
jgi:hypothetical protein